MAAMIQECESELTEGERQQISTCLSLANSQEVWPSQIRRSREVLQNRIIFSNIKSSHSYE